MPHVDPAVQEAILRAFTTREIFPGAEQLLHKLTQVRSVHTGFAQRLTPVRPQELNIPVALIRNTTLPSKQFQKHSLDTTGFNRYAWG